jgi:DNA invertase Pin-like site-specific DNA recombinase
MTRKNHPPATVRCAIYTRKSTEEGLEQNFNSLDAQREAALAYIQSQRHEGWKCLPVRYDDGGFTGGNMDRPALKRLLADVEAGKSQSPADLQRRGRHHRLVHNLVAQPRRHHGNPVAG